ncbi:MAG: cation transporter [Chitinophagales bacterium]|nr:cation transporter [Chitinophagales bacterium]
MHKFFLLFVTLLFTLRAIAGGTETVEIKTSAICGECKERIEKAVFEINGVKSAKLDLKTKVLTVKFSPDKTTVSAIREKVSKAGYDADDLKADKAAFEALPACCQMDLGY